MFNLFNLFEIFNHLFSFEFPETSSTPQTFKNLKLELKEYFLQKNVKALQIETYKF